MASIEERRAPVQGDYDKHTRRTEGAGSIAWEEHVEAWKGYARYCGGSQDAETIARRGGFGMGELRKFLGREPRTWRRA